MIYVLGDVSMLYFLLLLLRIGPASLFIWFFLILAVLLFFVGRLSGSAFWRELSGRVKRVIYIFVLCGMLLFLALEGLIIAGGARHMQENADYVVVLGCKVNGTTPSLSLQYRIDAAVEYLKAHPDSQAVLTGGQGIGEEITEAEAMYHGMVEQGIAGERLLLEKKSTTTKENLEFAKEYIDPEQDSIVIVSTNFHMYRAVKIAKAAGYRSVEGYSAKNVWYLIPADYIREALAILKNLALGNLG